MLPPKSTGDLQPLDLSNFGQLKLKYRKWLSEEMILGKDGDKDLTEERGSGEEICEDFQRSNQGANQLWIPRNKNSKISDRKR